MALGFGVQIEHDAGLAAGFDNSSYAAAGATLVSTDSVWRADVVAKVRPPDAEEPRLLGAGQVLVGFIYPAQHADVLGVLAARGATVVAMDQVPRTTRAQKVDALSAMGNLSGYRAVLEAAHVMARPFGGQTTAAGKIPPCQVLVIGAGVAGLSAIGTARALGAVVRAFDTRPAVREQVASMGAEFLEVHLEEDGTGTGGYAKEMSPAFIEAELALFAAQAREVDVIITTALIPGKPAPVLISRAMVASMRRGSVIVDLAAEQGGNCEATRAGDAVTVDGVTVIGYTDLPSRLARQASLLYAANIVNLLEEMGGAGRFAVDLTNDIVGPMTVLKDGARHTPRPVVTPPAEASSPTVPAPSTSSPGRTEDTKPSRPAPKKPHGRLSHAAPVAAPSARSWMGLGLAGLGLVALGVAAPPAFLTHFTVFVLACIVGYHVVWSVTPALHTPLMSVTNAISGIIVVGGMLQISSGVGSAATWLGLASIALATVNISGGFLVTHRMLKMFRR